MKNKPQISCTVTAKRISVFVFATQIVLSLCFLNPKCQASSHLLWLYSPLCVGPGKLISAFVFTTQIVLYLCFLNPKCQASSHLLWLYSPCCVGPGRKPRRPVFSRRGSFHVINSMRFELHVIHVVMSRSTTIQRNVILDFVVIVSRNETMLYCEYSEYTRRMSMLISVSAERTVQLSVPQIKSSSKSTKSWHRMAWYIVLDCFIKD